VLPKPHRITAPGDFSAVVRGGRRRGGAAIVVHSRPTSATAPARFGFVVSKAVGGSVDRNLVKRRLRASAASRIRDGLRGVDVVVRALPRAIDADWTTLDDELRRGLAVGR